MRRHDDELTTTHIPLRRCRFIIESAVPDYCVLKDFPPKHRGAFLSKTQGKY